MYSKSMSIKKANYLIKLMIITIFVGCASFNEKEINYSEFAAQKYNTALWPHPSPLPPITLLVRGKDYNFLKAAERGDAGEIIRLINQGVKINVEDAIGMTALEIACFNGHLNVVKTLLEKGADPNDKRNEQSLYWACVKGHQQIVEELIAKGANVNNIITTTGETPLMGAAFSGKVKIVEMLLAKGANVNAKNKIGYTPLMIAVKQGHKQIAEMLLAKGANIHSKDFKGRTALNMTKDNEIKEMLIKSGAKE